MFMLSRDCPNSTSQNCRFNASLWRLWRHSRVIAFRYLRRFLSLRRHMGSYSASGKSTFLLGLMPLRKRLVGITSWWCLVHFMTASWRASWFPPSPKSGFMNGKMWPCPRLLTSLHSASWNHGILFSGVLEAACDKITLFSRSSHGGYWRTRYRSTGRFRAFWPLNNLLLLTALDDVVYIIRYRRIYFLVWSGISFVNISFIGLEDGLHRVPEALAHLGDAGLWHFAPVLAHRGLQLLHIALADPKSSGCDVPLYASKHFWPPYWICLCFDEQATAHFRALNLLNKTMYLRRLNYAN